MEKPIVRTETNRNMVERRTGELEDEGFGNDHTPVSVNTKTNILTAILTNLKFLRQDLQQQFHGYRKFGGSSGAVLIEEDIEQRRVLEESGFNTSKRVMQSRNNNCLLIFTILAFLISTVLVVSVYLSYPPDHHSSSTSSIVALNVNPNAPKIAGVYILKNLDDNFDKFLKSLKIPIFLRFFIRRTREVVEMVEPTENNEIWQIKMKTSYGEHSIEFDMNETFHVNYEGGSRKALTHLCQHPKPLTISCETRAPDRGWNLKSVMEFTSTGFTDTKINLDEDIETIKTYIRLSELSENDQSVVITDDDLIYEKALSLPDVFEGDSTDNLEQEAEVEMPELELKNIEDMEIEAWE